MRASREVRTPPSELIARIGGRLGLTVYFETDDCVSGQIVASDGRKFYFRNTRFDFNGACAAAIADDKEWCAYHLLRMGYPVPDGRSFYSDAWCRRTGAAANIDAGYGYAREHLGLPVIVKANDGASGAGVTLVSNKRQYYRAMRAVFDELGKHVALVQRKVDGNDYRIIVLDGEVVSACQRLPLSVTGDGRHTIAQLLRTKLDDLADAGRHIILASRDYRVAMRLERIGKTWHTVPDEGEHVVLVDTANGSTGSDRIDLTEAIHPEVRRMASRIARDSGLRYCGIDLMTPGSIEQPLRSYTIIELDGAPALCLLNGMGTKQRRLETIIEKVLRAMTRPAR